MEEFNKPIAVDRENVEKIQYKGTGFVTYRVPQSVSFQGRMVPAYNTIGGLNIRVSRYIETVYKRYGHTPRVTEEDFVVEGKVISGEYLNKMINNTRVYGMVAEAEGISDEDAFYEYMEKNLYDFCHYKGKYFDQAMALLDQMSIGGKIGEMVSKDFFRKMVAEKGMVGTIEEPTLQQDSAGIDGFFRWDSKGVQREVTLQVKSCVSMSPSIDSVAKSHVFLQNTADMYNDISKKNPEETSDKQKGIVDKIKAARSTEVKAKTKGMVSLNIKGTNDLIDYLILYKLGHNLSEMTMEDAISVYGDIYSKSEIVILRVLRTKGDNSTQLVRWESGESKFFVFPQDSVVSIKLKS